MQPDSPSPDEPPFRVLTLDGGGAKGFYTLGILRELEAMLGGPLCERFDLIYGTSTGAIIAALLCLGKKVDDIHALYRDHVPKVMQPWRKRAKTAALSKLATEVFGDSAFTDVKTRIGIVSTRWVQETPMIFKSHSAQAFGRTGTFTAGFGVPIAQAVQASCSAYPFFERTFVHTSNGDTVELLDGGYCANNPTLYAIADALQVTKVSSRVRVVSLGVGGYPSPKGNIGKRIVNRWPTVRLLQKTLEINTQSMEQLRQILFSDVATVRISKTYKEPEMATDLLEYDIKKLNILRQRGAESFGEREKELKRLLT